ncbi:unnamed protein product [Mytilus coruscus]|uniref:Uncharacterized protein n=1 Tax=Mytilus coruscus TaxID=42192 RepID=A0A6J8BER9_MYTCO|nr:unnamed protein product [Mytilus coruscus]
MNQKQYPRESLHWPNLQFQVFALCCLVSYLLQKLSLLNLRVVNIFFFWSVHTGYSLDVTIFGQTYIEPGVPYNVSCTVDEYRDNRKTTFSTSLSSGVQLGTTIVWYYKPYGCFLWSNATVTDCRNASCACDDNGLTTHWTYNTPLILSPPVMFRCFTTDNDSRIVQSDPFEANLPRKLQILLTSTIRDLQKESDQEVN